MVIIDVLYLPAYPVGLCAKCQVIVPLIGGNGRKIGCSEPITLIKQTKPPPPKKKNTPGNLVCTTDVIWFRSHSSDCRKMAEYMVRHSSVSLSVITFSTQNILELYFGR